MSLPKQYLSKGLIISAPGSGTGKTTVMLGLCKALSKRGLNIQPFKNGPDYIDPAFHQRATGRYSTNLDTWAMKKEMITSELLENECDIALIEGSMGFFDGVADNGAYGIGSTADLARLTGWPVVIVLNVSGQAQSAAAVAMGFYKFDPNIKIAGVILNKVASARHESLIKTGMKQAGIRVLGSLPKEKSVSLPERHLGLIQAQETSSLENILSQLSNFVEENIDIDTLLQSAISSSESFELQKPNYINPPGQRIALARDEAFSFVYPHLLNSWHKSGAEVIPFSPLADQVPDLSADVVWLPGGYPELYAGKIASSQNFLAGLKTFVKTKPVHGECGGYMVMGQVLIDSNGENHLMAGLLGLVTSFEKRKMNLGYRKAKILSSIPSLEKGDIVSGHEFHYSTIIKQPDPPLAEITDAKNERVKEAGSRVDLASGTFFHMIAKL